MGAVGASVATAGTAASIGVVGGGVSAGASRSKGSTNAGAGRLSATGPRIRQATNISDPPTRSRPSARITAQDGVSWRGPRRRWLRGTNFWEGWGALSSPGKPG